MLVQDYQIPAAWLKDKVFGKRRENDLSFEGCRILTFVASEAGRRSLRFPLSATLLTTT